MPDVLTKLLEVSLGCSAVIVLLLALTPALSRKFSPRWRHWAWLMIALRLMLPGTDMDRRIVPAPVQLKLPCRFCRPAL